MSFIKRILIKMSFIRYNATSRDILSVLYLIVKRLDENIRILQQFKLMNDIFGEKIELRYTNSFMNY